MQTVKNVVIAAAGMGKRLGMGMPKTLVDIDTRKVVDFQLALFKNIENIYMVVGFCDQDVMRYVKQVRSDVIFVRNPDFKRTKTLESFYLAAKLIEGNAIFIDGDMIIPRKSFDSFVTRCKEVNSLIGVSTRISEDPVYAKVNENNEVVGFSYDEYSNYEWANMMFLDANKIRGGKENVFEFLEEILPLPAHCVERLEIDTQDDLENAKKEIEKGYFDGQ